jgi:flagellar M-ring protein FliF
MPEALNNILKPFMALPPGRRWMVGGVAVFSIAAFALLIFATNRVDYKPLFTNLTMEDAGEIVKKLKDQKIPYRISDDGKAILVPSEKVYDLRLSMASEGLPQGGGIGFEIFDRKNFGMTEFVQKLNYQRALQGELSRTISQIAGVEQARIHLVIPEKSLFKDNEKPPTASVVLRMKTNRILRDNEVQGIVHLVASSVEGMDPEHVTVLDQRGKVLSHLDGGDPTTRMTGTMLETQRGYEKSTEERLQSLLEKALGSEKSAARVSATFDFKQVEKYEEKYDPETAAVRSEQRSEEKSGVSAGSGGVPGVQSNLGRTAAGAGGTTSGGSRTDETINYEISKQTARVIEPVGTLAKLSVAVMIDGRYEGTGEARKYVPRTPEEIQQIDSLIKSAVGFNAERGDQVTVVNIPFQGVVEEPPVEPIPLWETPFFMSLLKNVLIAIGFLALIFLVIRPLVAALKSPQRTVYENFALSSEPSERQLPGGANPQVELKMANQMELMEKIRNDPYQAAQVLKNWLQHKE